MKLQLAFDDLSLCDALKLAEETKDFVDIFEIGTPFLLKEGIKAVREFKKYFPEKEILADTKIVDAGDFEAEMAFEAGADYCTVISVTDNLTINGCLKTCEKYEKKVFVDTINSPNLIERIASLEKMGVTNISVHVGVDEQAVGKTPLEELKLVKKIAKNSIISVAGGINEHTIAEYVAEKPDIIIVGSGIINSNSPLESAKTMFNKIHYVK
ncbi:3-hexulose-6-phosphate synthase [Enterococcus hulanensis]|uniref:3-hexulose-6-phosphate synthase n=1 Tax=Enterococcus hulanensis TaxID=2559929 RepID=A0ABU3F331_9ENTE|nr:3-hexulose-6-phosphate synthase [Enterococcus hulanensis]MDT2601528.1 3-hexulose-6-phosphate synthase [Enterococcus hulanensis]MDT2610929.1 3-hexulose-6-phosphate synthase [Enterococcus hulanensis]MDT2618334.1 3-hexulose-6-phosphate synthase [Enterococcus hulanensis]MDT2629463.1 3-hexulose-6-phosphate synthase [Enterococcus hulanensis]MDT2657025.1 3-hexulose-6-phosphate synthase [Enterococcus hulanensis]